MAGQREWNESLFGCFDDTGLCLYGCCCPPCLFGQNTERIDNSSCCLNCLAYGCLAEFYLCWIPHYMKREKLRMIYGLREDPCNDCLVTAFCGPCALCQEARFLNRNASPMGVVGAMATGPMQPVPMPTTQQPGRY